MESLTPENVQADIVWGTASLLVAMAIGTVVTAVGGPIAGAIAGGAVYAGLSILKGYNDLKEQENILKAYTYHSEEYRGTKTLSRKEYYDDMYADTMSTGITGNQYGVYMPVVYETKQNRYEGQAILAPKEYWKTSPELGTDSEGNLQLTSNLNKFNIDYYLQSRNYMGYSDYDDKRVKEFLDIHDVWNEDLDYLYGQNSLIYLENAVAQATREGNDDTLDTVLPYMSDYYPVLTFVDSEQYIGLPEFYEDYPILVADDIYEENKETYGKFIKIWDPQDGDGQEIKITPQGAVHMLQSDIEYINVYTLTQYEYRETLQDDEYSFDVESGTLILDSNVIDRFKKYIDSEYEDTPIVLECFVKQYRSINDSRGLSLEQMESIATMQSIQASLLEYMMQFQLAVESQSKMNEIAYTVAITVITTALTMGIGGALHIGGAGAMSLIKEPLEEVFVDPVVEAIATKIVKDLGGDEYAQMIAATLAESGREGLSLRGARQQAQFNRDVKTRMDAKTISKAEAQRQIKAEIEANQQDPSTASKVAKTALMTLSIFGLVLGMGGVFGTGGLGITGLSIFLMSHGGGFIDFLERLRQQEQINQNEVEVDNFIATIEADENRVYHSNLAFTSQFIENLKSSNSLFDVSDTQKSGQKPSQEYWQKFVEDMMDKTGKTYIELAYSNDKRIQQLLKDAYGEPKTYLVARGGPTDRLTGTFEYNWEKHPTRILIKEMLNIFNEYREPYFRGGREILPPSLSERGLTRLLDIRKSPSEKWKILKEGEHDWYTDESLLSWIKRVENDNRFSDETLRKLIDLVKRYRSPLVTGFSHPDADADRFIVAMRFIFTKSRTIIAEYKVRELLGLKDVNTEAGSGRTFKQEKFGRTMLRKILYGLYQLSSRNSRFVLEYLGKDSFDENIPEKLHDAADALLLFNAFTVSKGFDELYDPSPLTKLLLLSQWYLSDIDGDYANVMRLKDFFDIDSKGSVSDYLLGNKMPDDINQDKIRVGIKKLKTMVNNPVKIRRLTELLKAAEETFLEIERNLKQQVGSQTHDCFEDILIRYLLFKRINPDFEQKLAHGRRPDNTIYRIDSDGKVSQQWLDIEKNQQVIKDSRFEGIESILFDYYMGNREDHIFGPAVKYKDAKIVRNYHAKNRFLLIVLYGDQQASDIKRLKDHLALDQSKNPNGVIKNVEIVSFQEFLSFIGVANDPRFEQFLKEFNDANQEAIDAVNDGLTEDQRKVAQEKLKIRRIEARQRLDEFRRRTRYLGER